MMPAARGSQRSARSGFALGLEAKPDGAGPLVETCAESQRDVHLPSNRSAVRPPCDTPRSTGVARNGEARVLERQLAREAAVPADLPRGGGLEHPEEPPPIGQAASRSHTVNLDKRSELGDTPVLDHQGSPDPVGVDVPAALHLDRSLGSVCTRGQSHGGKQQERRADSADARKQWSGSTLRGSTRRGDGECITSTPRTRAGRL